MSSTLRSAAVVTAAATALLAGCAQAPTYGPETAERLQAQVLAVTSTTAEGDWSAASTRLLELEASASTALARGEITQERYDAIMAALTLVRADVDAAIAAAAAEAKAAADAQAAAEAEAARVAAEEAARAAEEASKREGNGKKKDQEKDDD